VDTLLAFARDSAWGFFGTLVAVIAAVAAWRLTPREKVKKLQFERFDDLLIGVKDNLDGRLELSYDGKPRSNIWFAKYQFRNIGTDSIAATDFERPISFAVMSDGPGELLRASIDIQYPPQLRLDISFTDRKATIAPAMLNPGDRFSVTLLLADRCKLAMDYRIAGLSKIEDVTSLPQDMAKSALPWPIRWGVVAVIFGFCCAIGLWAFEFGKSLARTL